MQMTTVKGTNDDTISAQPTLIRPAPEQNDAPEQQPRRKKVRRDQFIQNILAIQAHQEKKKS